MKRRLPSPVQPVMQIQDMRWKFKLDQRYPELWGRRPIDKTLSYNESVFVGEKADERCAST